MEYERAFEARPEQVFSAFLGELETVGQPDDDAHLADLGRLLDRVAHRLCMREP